MVMIKVTVPIKNKGDDFQMKVFCHIHFGLFGDNSWKWDPFPKIGFQEFLFKDGSDALVFALRWL
jgi:hypothetical protein